MAAPFYLAIHGRLVVIGKEPDGDSVRYQHPPGAVEACYVPTAERLKLHGRLFVAFIPATAKWPELDYYDAHGERVGLGAGGLGCSTPPTDLLPPC